MNWDKIEGNWSDVKGELKQQWGRLTDDDLDLIEGQRNKLVGRLQKRYGILADEAEMEIEDFLRDTETEIV